MDSGKIKYSGDFGVVEKFGRKWRWFKSLKFKVEPYYEFDPSPRWRSDKEKNELTYPVLYLGRRYDLPAKRIPCPACDGGIRHKLKLEPHTTCCCDRFDHTVIVVDKERFSEKEIEILDLYQQSYYKFDWNF